MKKIIITSLLLCVFGVKAQVKIGDNPTSVGTSSILELESTNKALVLTRVADTSEITSPVNGMMVYDLSTNCIKAYENGAWSACLSAASNALSPTSNGTAVVASYDCSGTATGTMSVGNEVSGVTQVITANVTLTGSYNISATFGGVTFSNADVFTEVGNQVITLTASGTPTTAGTGTFTLNTDPNCSFSRSISANYSTTACSTTYGNYPATVDVEGTSVTVTKTGDGPSGSINNTTCGMSITGSAVGFSGSESATYTLSLPLKNVQVYGYNNESDEGNEGYTVSASLAGAPVAVQLSAIDGTCQSAFTSTQSGNSASIRNTNSTDTSSLIFNVSSADAYDKIIISRAAGGSAGTNGYGLMFCNATTAPNSASNGTAVISSYSCSVASQGALAVDIPVSSDVQQTITANVTTAGTYNITATANGVTFSKSGTFAATGAQTVVLTATGTPTVAGTGTFELNTTPSCSFDRTISESFNTTLCSTGYGSYPQTVTVNGSSVTVSKTGGGVTGANYDSCGINISGERLTGFTGTQGVTYSFSSPLKNVQVYGMSNESGEGNEGYTVTASLGGSPVAVQLVPFAGTCNSNFTSTQDGNSASIRNTGSPSTVSVLFNISASGLYDTLTISRIGDSVGNHANTHSLLLCNASTTP
ncbi:hypothetical protein DVK85_06220 [Flavobacterium arcticum]|uniref:Uncharacterized protein n=1 Tax=Flavobacterium arcticum TaxID=1784713 RepID=A0A345HB95_9FLAO|nr:hypothetical protein [Flavobacterium arcticum]AXG73855.1 hypothetical protein DVK85_06220 [Flavobacterium arcticum]KAF2511808.1 hypothetical protein E0W72_05740 [Flavobacterium arcticum]